MRKYLIFLLIPFLFSCRTPDIEEVSKDFPAGISIEWVGPNVSGAAVEQKLNNVTMSADKIYYTHDPLDWPVSKDNLNSILYVFFMRDGKLKGGKFEYSRPGYKSQHVKNIYSGYIKGIKPVPGEEGYFCMSSLDFKKRTNAIKFIWTGK